MEMEPSTEYVSIFSHSFRDEIIKLLLKITKCLHSSNISVPPKLQSASSSSNNFVSSVLNFLFSESSNSESPHSANTESMKTKHHLECSIEYISSIFDIPQQSIQTIISNEKNTLHSSDAVDANASSKSKLFCYFSIFILSITDREYEYVDGIPKLSEVGRHLVLNGTLKPQNYRNLIQGNPDTQPVRTFEIAVLVKLALLISAYINKDYGNTLAKYYNMRQNIFGIFLQQILSPPVKYVQYRKSQETLRTEMTIETLPPRVNLRFMASIEFLFYIIIMSLFLFLLSLFNCSPLSTVLMFSVAFVFYLCIKSIITSLKDN